MSRDGVEVRPILPLYAALIDQLQIRLVNQGRRREREIGTFSPESPPRKPVQLVDTASNNRLLAASSPSLQASSKAVTSAASAMLPFLYLSLAAFGHGSLRFSSLPSESAVQPITKRPLVTIRTVSRPQLRSRS